MLWRKYWFRLKRYHDLLVSLIHGFDHLGDLVRDIHKQPNNYLKSLDTIFELTIEFRTLLFRNFTKLLKFRKVYRKKHDKLMKKRSKLNPNKLQKDMNNVQKELKDSKDRLLKKQYTTLKKKQKKESHDYDKLTGKIKDYKSKIKNIDSVIKKYQKLIRTLYLEAKHQHKKIISQMILKELSIRTIRILIWHSKIETIQLEKTAEIKFDLKTDFSKRFEKELKHQTYIGNYLIILFHKIKHKYRNMAVNTIDERKKEHFLSKCKAKEDKIALRLKQQAVRQSLDTKRKAADVEQLKAA